MSIDSFNGKKTAAVANLIHQPELQRQHINVVLKKCSVSKWRLTVGESLTDCCEDFPDADFGTIPGPSSRGLAGWVVLGHSRRHRGVRKHI
jgi:hypothetical protein